jgi:transcriptional coactivator HFI1/ADA1
MNPRASLSGVSSAPLQKSKLPTAIATAPRVDVEPIYTQLKGMIGENWQLYKQTVAEFVIGKFLSSFT